MPLVERDCRLVDPTSRNLSSSCEDERCELSALVANLVLVALKNTTTNSRPDDESRGRQDDRLRDSRVSSPTLITSGYALQTPDIDIRALARRSSSFDPTDERRKKAAADEWKIALRDGRCLWSNETTVVFKADETTNVATWPSDYDSLGPSLSAENARASIHNGSNAP